MAEKIKKDINFAVGDLVTPRDLNKVMNDELLDTDGKKIIQNSDSRGIVTQVQDDLYYVTYTASGLGIITQVYKKDEVKFAV